MQRIKLELQTAQLDAADMRASQAATPAAVASDAAKKDSGDINDEVADDDQEPTRQQDVALKRCPLLERHLVIERRPVIHGNAPQIKYESQRARP